MASLFFITRTEYLRMSLIASDGAAAANTALNAQINRLNQSQALKTPSEMAVELAAAYHDYAKTAILPGADCTAGGTVSILEAAFVSDNTSAMVAKIAQGICDYWSSFITPTSITDPETGLYPHGGTSVVSVVVNGTAVLAAMTAAVQALITNTAKVDAWLDFYNATQAVVNTIPCVITEMIPGTPPVPTPFPEVIS